MPLNLELKIRIQSIDAVVRRLRQIHAQYKGASNQKDIYYNIAHGRLKIRVVNKGIAELIFYDRPDKKGSRYSEYFVVPITNAKLMDVLCTSAFGRKVIVEKKRRLYMYKNARIHVDTVRSLGDFLEFEVIVKQGRKQARRILDFLTTRFNISRASPVAVSYSDLMLQLKQLHGYHYCR